MTEIETVTVDFEELKAEINRYYAMKKVKRLVIVRDGEEISVVGRWLSKESRARYLPWHELLYELFPDPFDPEDREPGRRALEEVRGYRPFST